VIGLRNLILLTTVLALSQTGVVVYLSFAVLTGYWLADDKLLATLPLALQFVGMALVVMPISVLMRRYGRQAGFMIGHLLGLSGSVLACWSVWAHNFELFCAAALLIGAHNAIWQHFRFAAVECVGASRRSLAVGLVLSGGVAAAFLGTPLAVWGEWLMPVLYAGGYALMAVLCLLGLIILSFLNIERPAQPDTVNTGRPLGIIIRSPKFILAASVSSLSFALMAFVMNATPLAMQLCGFDISDSNRVVQLHTLGMFAPSFLTGALIRWQGHNRTILAGLLCFSVAIIINLSGIEFYHFATALTLVGLGWNLMFISATDLLTETHSVSEKEKVQATHDLFMFTIVGVSNYFAGQSLLLLGWEVLNLLALVPLMLLLLVLIWRSIKPAPCTAIDPVTDPAQS